VTLTPIRSTDRAGRMAEIERLRARVERLQQPAPGRALPTHPALAEVASLRAGGVYAVDGVPLALTALAGPSRAGEWGAVVGVPDFGAEAAVELGVALERTILVPTPGEHWLEATAALVDVAGLVVVRPPSAVPARTAERIQARLRTRGAALVALCDLPGADWPRADLRLSAEQRWHGVGQGEGRLRERSLRIRAQRGRQGQRWAAGLPDAAREVG
jgi:hypothetical protein